MQTFKNTDLLEPSEFYTKQLKDAFHENATKLFEEMDKKANINVDANQTACKVYYKEAEQVNNLTKKVKGMRVGKGFSIFFAIATLLGGGVLIALKNSIFKDNPTLGIICGILLIVVGIGLIVLAIVLSKKAKALDKVIAGHQEKADKAKAEATTTMEPLNSQLEWNMAAELMSKTTPLIQLDKVFDAKKYELLSENYGYTENKSTNSSMVFVQSGSILGNPFVFEKTNCQTMRMHRYTGTKTVTVVVPVRDSNGRTRMETRTQVLTAYLDKEEPAYYLDTTLVYGNEAAPKLSFSRQPSKVNSMDEGKAERYIKDFDKKLDKLVDKSITKGGNFTRLGNEAFEARFDALDRDNEVEFRLLFTPLAQANMIKVLTDSTNGFGDDFYFKKKLKLNYVTCGHMQESDSLDRSPESLMNFDYNKAKDSFVAYCDKYLKDIFFNMAPLLSIPLYQQYKTREYIYKDTFKHNVTQAEAECAANAHGASAFAHPATRSSGVILKSEFVKKVDKVDVCNITAHSFEGIERVTLVPVRAQDGKIHDVPVTWIEYLPISKTTSFAVTDTEQNLNGYREEKAKGTYDKIVSKFNESSDMLYKKRILSFLMKDK